MSNDELRPILKELGGTKCACGQKKTARQTFCKGHYFGLPKGMRDRLYDPVGEGYVEAYRAACKHLNLQPAGEEVSNG